MDEEDSHGQMDEYTRESTKKTRNMDMESSRGQMEEHIRGSGQMGNSMGLESIRAILGRSTVECGRGAKESVDYYYY